MLLAGAFVSVATVAIATATTYEPLSVAIQGSGAVHLSSGTSIQCCAANCPAGPALAAPNRVTLSTVPTQD